MHVFLADGGVAMGIMMRHHMPNVWCPNDAFAPPRWLSHHGLSWQGLPSVLAWAP
jgi:hypothetical protein